ncbi:imelysin family protein [Devosia sp. 63-57]|uniref:imelysin family protein n=1 Tax=Devosia sp. 63-57 TaxID=1895751 RepID=UPI0008692181|nr:imelysin family protein [Devosia sp. 63-57]ODT47790.1 MAG: hypothetical protein ABS74_16290 [Pelagibacterium sp. SCN 63-126]ODU87217.1 MAG: hypothetical protein ABT14_05590 [Pelagibacterium sp. SCN 63-17]OJX42500.1 MAG: hypothetical protein BGO80_13560 [Devosia sp. 63-57]
MRKALVLIAFLLTPPAMADETLLPADLGERVVERFVASTVTGFSAATEALVTTSDALCAVPSVEHLATTRAAFGEVVESWGRLSVLRFGPLVSDNRFETVFFWPDPRGVTLKQVQAALLEQDPSVTDPETLAGKSVALQNLFALDYLLDGTDAATLATGDAHRCAYARAVAVMLSRQAHAIAAGWSEDAPIGGSFRDPGEDGYFRSQTEVMGELVKALLTGVDFVRSAELLPALGETIADARGKRAPLWRSDLTFALVRAQLTGLHDLLEATSLNESLPDANVSPVRNVLFNLEQASRAMDGITQPAEAAFGEVESRKRLDFVALQLGYSSTAIGEDMTASLGLAMGFNALDGD